VVSNGRIADMGPAAKVKTPEGAEVIDFSDPAIIPGIINLHSHIGENTLAAFAPTQSTASPAQPDLR
jgi:imidazolonepropionase-like amidohydrolase